MEERLKQFGLLLIAAAAFGLACGRGEIKGTYEVELEIAGATRPLQGTLILSTKPLDIPSLAEEDESIDSNWFGGDALSANSCFILAPSGSPATNSQSDPGVVRVFEARIQPDGVLTPIEILNASDLRIEIVKLQFFSNAVGGELDVHMAQGVRPGRIHGSRTGEASSQRCTEALADFRELLRELPATDETRS
jgi:hypothetical protein